MDASRDASLGVPYALVESYTAMAVSSSPLRSVYALVESYAAWLLPWDVDVERVKDVLAFYALFCATWSIAKAIYRTVRIFLCVFGEIANMFAAYHMASHVFARLRVKQEQQEKEQKQKQEQEKDQVSRGPQDGSDQHSEEVFQDILDRGQRIPEVPTPVGMPRAMYGCDNITTSGVYHTLPDCHQFKLKSKPNKKVFRLRKCPDCP